VLWYRTASVLPTCITCICDSQVLQAAVFIDRCQAVLVGADAVTPTAAVNKVRWGCECPCVCCVALHSAAPAALLCSSALLRVAGYTSVGHYQLPALKPAWAQAIRPFSDLPQLCLLPCLLPRCMPLP
jgi:hypothetical protein